MSRKRRKEQGRPHPIMPLPSRLRLTYIDAYLYHGHLRRNILLTPPSSPLFTDKRSWVTLLPLLGKGSARFGDVRASSSERARWEFDHEKAHTTPSNVPKTAILTGTARTIVGTKPRQKTRTRAPQPPPAASAYSSRAARHNVPPPPPPALLLLLLMSCACMRVLITSKGNVPNQPMIPAAPPARRSGAHGRWFGRESVSATSSSTSAGSAWCAGLDGAKRRSVPSYF